MNTPLWTGPDLIAAMGAASHGAIPAMINGVSIDTRTLQPGDLFVALEGDNRDGHAFVRAALEKGAAAALVSHAKATDLAGTGALIAVPHVLRGLEDLGRAARARTSARVLAVTGSVGKTGTKEALRHVLTAQGATHASVASYNNHWGVPLTLARTPAASDYCVYEMGMSAPDEIRPLSLMARPHVAIITTVEPVHIEFFKAIEGIADAKGEIFAGLEQGGTAIINRDNPHFARLMAHAMASPAGRIVTFGEHEQANVRGVSIATDADGSDMRVSLFGRTLHLRLGTSGRHNALNALAVLAGVQALGADVDVAAEALAHLTPVIGRGARERIALPGGGEAVLVDESYNANPASMRAALSVLNGLSPQPGGRRIAVLGDMLELGVQGADLHAGLVGSVNDACDLLFASGHLMKNLWDAIPPARCGAYAADAAALAPHVLAAIKPGDVVMVKGSNGSRMGQIVAALRALSNETAA
jgi:UDP-N-acetylmuramoyl-tripeptide--D-alanyl-D-alanine ligase